MLIILLSIVASNIVSSAPVLSSADPAIPLTVFGREPSEYVNAAHYRTIQDVIWSCLATIFACTWVAVHPNVSRPQDSGWVRFREKTLVMVYAILAPEFVIVWALRQRRGAERKTKDYYKKFYPELIPPSRSMWWYTRNWFCQQDEKPDHLWTITHGFLLEMHGFVDESGKTVHSVDEILDPLDISEEEINDKSKGDFLTKSLVLAQTTWFIVQCVTRLITRLPTTQLEVATLAFALLNIGTYALWWNKPQNMCVAIRMDRYRRTKDQPEQNETMGGDEESTIQEILLETASKQNMDDACHLSGSKSSLEDQPKAVVAERWVYSPSALMDRAVILFDPRRFQPFRFKRIIAAPFKPLMAMAVDPRIDECDYVFYSSGISNFRIPLSFMAIGIMFGGLHLIPLWSSSFPSPSEYTVWKIFAGWIVIQPSLGFCSIFFVAVASEEFESLIGTFALMVFGSYLIARIILIVLTFTTLRGLPPDTFQDVPWTTFFPHI